MNRHFNKNMPISFTVYFDASEDCHDLNFSVGQTGIGVTAATTRSFNIKVYMFELVLGQTQLGITNFVQF